jgi:hypothetical protein
MLITPIHCLRYDADSLQEFLKYALAGKTAEQF